MVCDCGTPWTLLLIFFDEFLVCDNLLSNISYRDNCTMWNILEKKNKKKQKKTIEIVHDHPN